MDSYHKSLLYTFFSGPVIIMHTFILFGILLIPISMQANGELEKDLTAYRCGKDCIKLLNYEFFESVNESFDKVQQIATEWEHILTSSCKDWRQDRTFQKYWFAGAHRQLEKVNINQMVESLQWTGRQAEMMYGSYYFFLELLRNLKDLDPSFWLDYFKQHKKEFDDIFPKIDDFIAPFFEMLLKASPTAL